MPEASKVFTKDELYAAKTPLIYEGEQLREIAFPLGGLGTGCVSLAGNGGLVDWEIFNRPNKGSVLPYSFFTIFAQAAALGKMSGKEAAIQAATELNAAIEEELAKQD